MNLLTLQGISKTFNSHKQSCIVLENINLTINQKDFISIMGVSGSGKTTLLNILGGFEPVSEGKITKVKGLKINYVTQQAHFIEELTVLDNLIFASLNVKITQQEIINYCDYFECSHLIKKKPAHLSGGEKQRINIIRALLTKPDLIILDEPTAALDYHNKIKVAQTLDSIWQKENLSIVLVTHDREILKHITQHTSYELKNKQLLKLVH
jgi:ABC-type lipoprotein export system ATPase subunit